MSRSYGNSLDDDEDTAEMYLTEKLMQQLENSSTSLMNERDDMEAEVLQSNLNHRTAAEILLEATVGSTSNKINLQNTENTHNNLFTQNLLSRGSHGTCTSTTDSAISKYLDVEELEMLLEA